MKEYTAWETEINLANISKEVNQTKRLVEKRFSDKIRIIGKLIERQTSLIGIYTKEILVRKAARLKYQDNAVLNNTLLNLPYRGLSVLLHIRDTFYGSARIVCRQFFESLMIAKYGEHDSTIVRKWEMKDDTKPGRDRSKEISLGPDVFVKLEARGKNITTLRQTWRDLCNADHPTKFSQQFLRFPDAEDKGALTKWLIDTHFLENTEYTLDLLLTLIAMNFHLVLAYYGRKANRWYFGYLHDPYGNYDQEREIKKDCKKLFKEYFGLTKGHTSASQLWKRNIFEFRQSWGTVDSLTEV